MLQRSMKIYLVFLLLSVTELMRATADNTVVHEIAGFNAPQGIASTPDGLFVYVCNSSSNNVIVVDTTTNTIVTGPGLPITVGTNPRGIVIGTTIHGVYAYVTNNLNDTISVINTATNMVVGSITVGEGVLGGPSTIAMTPNGAFVYVTIPGTSSVVVISTETNTVVGLSITVGVSPAGIAVTPDGRYVYVVNSKGTSLSVISTATNTVTTTITVGVGTGPSAIAIAPDGLHGYIIASNAIQVLDIGTNTITDTISGFSGANNLAITPDGSTVYVGSSGGNTIYIFDTVSKTLIGTVNLNSFTFLGITGLVVLPHQSYLYTTSSSGNNAVVVYTFPLISILPPSSIVGLSQSDVFFTQTDYINTITWTAPTSGETPVSYKMYRDAGLTELLATIPATDPLQYFDHNRIPGITYNYYVVSVDGANIASTPVNVSVTTLNN